MKIIIQCLLVLLTVVCFMPAVDSQNNFYILKPEYDICYPEIEVDNPKVIYLELGQWTEVYVNGTYNIAAPSNINCLLYVKTCNNCYLKVEAKSIFNYSDCQKKVLYDYDDDDHGDTCTPGCVNLFLFDDDYKNQTAKIIAKSNDTYMYKSQSKLLHIFACGLYYKHDIDIRLRIISMEKVEQLSPGPSDIYFESPYFPSPYAKNSEYYTYKIQADSVYKVIVVSFDDWLISLNSKLEFQSPGNVNPLSQASFNGGINRPFYISNGSSLTVRFYTGEPIASSSSFLGFRARVQPYFHPSMLIPSTECDRVIQSDGGSIIMSTPDGKLCDCIWIIRKMPDYTGVYVKVIKFEQSYSRYDSSDMSLQIRNEITSKGDLLLNGRPNDPLINSSGFQSTSGFYIRVRGTFNYGDTLVLSYAMHTYDCLSYRGYFRCDNGQCIFGTLKCDGFDHCGDNSDEFKSICAVEHTRSSSSDPISIGVIIPLVVSVLLIIIMCVLILFIRRCRRLNNAANRRPPGVRPPQSRGRRHRRHRDVQMSVTLSSGEHPPSYDEVLQSTPIGYLNMAFTWSQHGNGLTQPPSYEEAVSPTTSQPNGSIIITATANSSDASTNPQQQSSASVLATTISASLDPRADVSSSSSSEGVIDPYRSLDLSSSSDSAMENDPMIMNNSSLEHARSVTNLCKASKSGGEVRSHGTPKYGHENTGVQVVLKTPSSDKLNTEIHEGVRSEHNRRKEETKSNKSHNVVNGMNRHNETDSQDKRRGSGNIRNVADDRGIQNPHSSERRQEVRRNEGENFGLSRSEHGENERARREDREKCEVYRKNKGQRSAYTGERVSSQFPSHGDYRRYDNGGVNTRPGKVTDSSRSQSCVDLSWGGGAMSLPNASRTGLRDEDKRFSYAGAGDVLLQKSLDPFYNSRGLVREKPIEHLDKYASQSNDNLRDGYRARRHDHRNYEMDNQQDISSRQITSPDQMTYYPGSKRDKPELLQPEFKYSGLAPVLENLSDEVYETPRLLDESSRNKHTSLKDAVNKSQESTSENSLWTDRPNVRSSSQNGSGPSQIQPITAQKASSHNARGANAGHFPLETRFQPSGITNLTSSPHNYCPGDQNKYSQCQNNRQNPEPHSSKQNCETKSNNQNSKSSRSSTTPSDIRDSISHSPHSTSMPRHQDSGLLQEQKNQQSNQHPETTAAKPKPTLRKQFQAALKPDREAPQANPKPNSHSQFQTSQKPTPAPRQGVKKRREVDASNSEFVPTGNQNYLPDNVPYDRSTQSRPLSSARDPDQTSVQQITLSGRSQSDSQHAGEIQETGRWIADGKRSREEESLSNSEQLSSRGQVQVQTTNDDVFV